MKLRNSFTNETRLLFIDAWFCFKCGKNQEIELHHIIGRDSNSPYNAIPLCHNCHEAVTHEDEEEARFMYKTYKFLTITDFEPAEEDKVFYKQHLNI